MTEQRDPAVPFAGAIHQMGDAAFDAEGVAVGVKDRNARHGFDRACGVGDRAVTVAGDGVENAVGKKFPHRFKVPHKITQKKDMAGGGLLGKDTLQRAAPAVGIGHHQKAHANHLIKSEIFS